MGPRALAPGRQIAIPAASCSGAAADAMRAFTGGGSRRAHRYELADFGLTAADVRARFSGLTVDLR